VHRHINNILIIRFSSIGDIILTSPLIRSLRAAYPGATIDFLIKEKYSELVKYNPDLSAVHELVTNEFDELRDIVVKLRVQKYDLVIDLHNSLRSRYVRWFVRAKRVTVVHKRVVPRFFLVHFKWNFYRSIIPVAERYLETIRRFGVTNDGNGLEVSIPSEIGEMVKIRAEKLHLENYPLVIGLAPSARHETKRWPQQRYVDLGIVLGKQHHAKLLIFGSKDEREYCDDIAQMINAVLGAPVAESMAGTLSLLETGILMDYCRLIVCNDTGLLHMASARKRKVVAVYGSTVKELGFYPYLTEYRVVERGDVDCRPCSHIGRDACPKKHFRCMNDISVGDVLMAVQSLIQTGGTN
jgi:lipopolysaccharide heptosyltransferase II